jgi:cell surface protein SprA
MRISKVFAFAAFSLVAGIFAAFPSEARWSGSSASPSQFVSDFSEHPSSGAYAFAVQDSNPPQAAPDTSGFHKKPVAVFDTTSPGIQLLLKAATDTTRRRVLLDSLKRDFALKDSLHHADTLVIDTTYVVDKDSTARLEQFKAAHEDSPSPEIFVHKPYPLFLNVESAAYKREVSLDSTGRFVTVHETVNGVDVKVPVTMTLDDYTKMRYEEEKRNNWRSMVYDYKLGKVKDDIANLFGTLTNISIPMPANPLLSIFGKNVINLKISGQVDIHAAFMSQSSDQQTQSALDQTQNTPNFNQDVAITVNGTIGDKLKISADWNTQRTFEYENQLKINYTGYDDEIVQSVEAGNVSMEAPSLIGGGQALFGIKAKMQMGPLSLTTLASQKKGEAKSVNVSGGQSSQPVDILPGLYSTQYYFLDTLYMPFWEGFHNTVIRSSTPSESYYRVSGNTSADAQLEVWVSSTASSNVLATTDHRVANAFIELPEHPDGQTYHQFVGDGRYDTITTQTGNGTGYSGYFTKLQPSKYTLDPQSGTIALQDPTDNVAIAVAYKVFGLPNQTYGELTSARSDTGRLTLKLIKPPTVIPSYPTAWKLQLKNVYNVGGTNIQSAGFSLDVFIKTSGLADQKVLFGVPIIQVLGLDQYQPDGTGNPDGKFDYLTPGSYPLHIDPVRGDVLFPSLYPFDSGIVEYTKLKGMPYPADSLLFPQVYDTDRVSLSLLPSQYYIHVVAATSQRSRISLGSFNIVEGSVQVTLNGATLTAGTDYTVDYIVGEVNMLNQQALQPGANLNITFEQNDVFDLASKTLVGARAEIGSATTAQLGATIMSYNQSSLSQKVRIGEEPMQNTIMGVDGGFGEDLPFLTSALDAIPFLRAKDMSNIQFHGEGAYIVPNPNTSVSTVASDNGASVAYIDDFEGALRTIPFTLTDAAWFMASPPYYSPSFVSGVPGRHVSPDTLTWTKSKLTWYDNASNIDPVNVHDIWPQKSVAAEDQLVTVLEMAFDPNRRGTYNFSSNVDSSLHREQLNSKSGKFANSDLRKNNWNGIMRYIGPLAGDLTSQNIQYLEVWVNVDSGDITNDLRKNGRLYVDLGSVSEDVIPDGILESEDRIVTPDVPNAQTFPTGRVTADQDLGLDMLADDSEKVVHAAFLKSNNGDPDVSGADPSGDNYAYTTGSNNFNQFNGTEGDYNGGGKVGRYPATEDLNGNAQLDQTDSYLEYEVPLDSTYTDTLGLTRSNTLIVGGNAPKRWYQLRIPLNQATRFISSSGQSALDILQNVQFVRLWLGGFQKRVVVRFAEIQLVGNQWAQLAQNDSTMKISVVSVEDNPNYTIPPGVGRPLDLTRPDQQVYGNEQSLDLIMTQLLTGQSRQAVKYSSAKPMNVFNYKQMKMFVHGDPSMRGTNVFLRFGADTLNYYEYRLPIVAVPLYADWFEMTIDFTTLALVKSYRDKDTAVHADSLYRQPGTPYGIEGNPSLTTIVYMGIGVENPASLGKVSVSGEIWVDELRVVGADNSRGFAYHFDTELKLSDLGNVSFNYAMTDPHFHSLTDNFGSLQTSDNWSVNSSLAFDKYFPLEMNGSTLSVGYSHVESILKPLYLPNSDIAVTAAAADAAENAARTGGNAKAASDSVITVAQTLHTGNTYSIPGFRLAFPEMPWFIRESVGKLTYHFTYANSFDRNPTTLSSTTWQWDASTSYAENIQTEFTLSPFKWLFSGLSFLDGYKDLKIYLIPPISMNASIDGGRTASFQASRDTGVALQVSRTFGVTKSGGFGWRLTDNGLLNLSGDYSLSVQRDLQYLNQDDSLTGRGFGTILSEMFLGGRDGSYNQKVDVNTKPRLPSILDIPKYFDLTAAYSVSYGWKNAFQGGDLGKSAHWGNTISMSTNIRLKSLTDPWFKFLTSSSNDITSGAPEAVRNAPPVQRAPGDTSKTPPPLDTAKAFTRKPQTPTDIFAPVKGFLKYFVKTPFLDFETINVSFQQANGAGSGGIPGSAGIDNFFYKSVDPSAGPSRLYQLGLVSDPTGYPKFDPSSRFPFIGWSTIPGARADSGQLTDQFQESNSIALRTNRALWDGATIELDWKVAWQYSRSTSFSTDGRGYTIDSSVQTTTNGSIDRSFLSLPPIFFLKFLNSNIANVGKKYTADSTAGMPPDQAIADAFEHGLETLPVLSKVLGDFVPRPNWTIHWDGLQKIGFLGSVFKTLSLDHAYTSDYKNSFTGNPDGSKTVSIEAVNYGFAPLIGLTATPKDLFGGNVTGSFKYSTTTEYDLSVASENITQTYTQDISFSLSYGRHGFSLPIFGINLQNDMDFSMTYSLSRNSRAIYEDFSSLESDPDGEPLDGTTRTTLEPQIKYGISSRVTGSIYYRYTSIAPDAGSGSTIFGSTTNEAGVDIHISIQ